MKGTKETTCRFAIVQIDHYNVGIKDAELSLHRIPYVLVGAADFYIDERSRHVRAKQKRLRKEKSWVTYVLP